MGKGLSSHRPHRRTWLEEVEHEELRLEEHFHIRHIHKYVVGYLLLLLAVIVFSGVYSWQHRRVVEMEQQVQQVSARLESMYR